jgi:Trk K+ transport system NAD-binding subunit
MGAAFATMMISTIVLSQLLGPPLFKWAIQRVGEAHLQAPGHEFDGVRDAVIFGLEGQSVALAKQLTANGWNAKIATRQPSKVKDVADTDIQIQIIPGLTVAAMHQLNLEHADAVIAMLSDDENYQIAETVFEHFGTKRMIVRLSQLESSDRFAQLGAIVVEPATAMVGLLDHFVRAPTATSLLLDREPNQHVADIQVTNPNVHGVTIRDLRLPLDVLIVSVTRNDVTLVSHGYTQIEFGDYVSAIGSRQGLEQVLRQLEA